MAVLRRFYALIQLNMCKVVQVFDAWLSGEIKNSLRTRAVAALLKLTSLWQ